MHDNTTEKEPVPIMTRLFQRCLLLLAAVVVLCIALELLAQIWGWLLLLLGVAGLVWLVIWFIRWRRDRRW